MNFFYRVSKLVAMALSLPAGESHSLILTLSFFVVVFSILAQGLTIGRVVGSPTARWQVLRRFRTQQS
ncbi:MAG: hypothetical protein IPJ12_04045 [Betaproteobacteria bacterium]|nr:hypothetical protein [Betaproteobacteria bacterium]